MSRESEYPVGGSSLSTARLNLQHCLIKQILKGNLLDPSIPFKQPSLRIADICSGTGIWLLELAERVPSTTHLDGFDINVSQTPPKEWLPANVKFKYFNIFEEVPEQFIESYDIIHVQLTLTFVKDDKFRTVLQNVLKMLKPGGFIQWIEGDYAHLQFFSSDPGKQPKDIELATVECFQMMNLVSIRWVADLPSIFEQTPHLTLVSTETTKVNHGLLRTLSELHLWGIEEACATVLRRFPQFSQRVEMVRKLARTAENKVVGEAGIWEGVWAPIVSVVGRKESI